LKLLFYWACWLVEEIERPRRGWYPFPLEPDRNLALRAAIAHGAPAAALSIKRGLTAEEIFVSIHPDGQTTGTTLNKKLSLFIYPIGIASAFQVSDPPASIEQMLCDDFLDIFICEGIMHAQLLT